MVQKTLFTAIVFAASAGFAAAQEQPKPTPPKAAQSGQVGKSSQVGMASFYGDKFQGRRTASGEAYRHASMTAAHRTLGFGRTARVTSLATGRSVVVRINDRGPFVRGRVIDVSKGAARQLGFVNRGVARVRVQPL